MSKAKEVYINWEQGKVLPVKIDKFTIPTIVEVSPDEFLELILVKTPKGTKSLPTDDIYSPLETIKKTRRGLKRSVIKEEKVTGPIPVYKGFVNFIEGDRLN